MVIVLSFLGRNLKPVNLTWLGFHHLTINFRKVEALNADCHSPMIRKYVSIKNVSILCFSKSFTIRKYVSILCFNKCFNRNCTISTEIPNLGVWCEKIIQLKFRSRGRTKIRLRNRLLVSLGIRLQPKTSKPPIPCDSNTATVVVSSAS